MSGQIEVWKPIGSLKNPENLAVPELRSLFQIWREQSAILKGSENLRIFSEKWIRRWSIETGILERIYDVTRGITEVLVEQGFNASLIPHGASDRDAQEVVDILNDHFEAHNFIMDLIGGKRELSVSWIKELHQLITRNQEYTTGIDAFKQRHKIPLIKGDWKKQPNNPSRPDGTVAIYCPPEQVASEMDNMVRYYNEISAEYPEVRAAWLHHRFSQIHPFQDGNGRVARCLANLDFIKAGGFPIIVQRDDRANYIKALESADTGDLKPLVNLFAALERNAFLQAISISQETIQKDSALDTILEAAERRIESRRMSQRQKVDEFANVLRENAYQFLESNSSKIEVRMKKTLPGLKVRITRNQPGEEHFYRGQIMRIAGSFKYWVDFSESRYWTKMAVRDGNSCNFVVVLHQVGRPSTGTGVAVAFIEFLEPKEKEAKAEFSCITCAMEPFLFTYHDNLENIRQKFSEWLNQSFLAGMAEWQSRL